MSSKQQVLIVAPPIFEKDINGEHFRFIDIVCPTCNGSGEVPVHVDYLGLEPADMDSCQRCSGQGLLIADVVIRWKADETVVNKQNDMKK